MNERIGTPREMLRLLSLYSPSDTTLQAFHTHRTRRKAHAAYLHLRTCHYTHTISLNDIAAGSVHEPLGISALFQTLQRHNLLAYLTAYRIDTACEMLKTTAVNRRDYGAVGFNDIPRFQPPFKRQKQLSPRAYRAHSSNLPSTPGIHSAPTSSGFFPPLFSPTALLNFLHSPALSFSLFLTFCRK